MVAFIVRVYCVLCLTRLHLQYSVATGGHHMKMVACCVCFTDFTLCLSLMHAGVSGILATAGAGRLR